ncbi:MAG: tetratricopeptide repeat protein [Planctomycetota bacterium]
MDVSKLVERADEAAERRNYDYAIDLYLQSCKLDPDNATARRKLRAVENRMAKEKGSSFWSKTKGTGLAVQVQGLLLARKYDAAIEKAEDVLKINPDNINVQMLLGRALISGGYRKSAISTFEDIKNANAGGNIKQLVEAFRELATVYEADSRIKDAQDIWLGLLKLVPGDREASVKIRDLSAKTMTETIQNAAVAGERGSAARTTQTNIQKQEQAVLDIESSGIKTQEDLRTILEYTQNQIAQRPDDPKLYSKLGDFYKQGSHYNEAKKAYEQAREKDPNNPTYLFRLHDLDIWKLRNALRKLEHKVKAGDMAVVEQHNRDRLSLLEFRLKSFLEREKQYSTDSSIKFELGSVYFELAKVKSVREMYDQAIMRFQSTFHDPKFRLESGLRMGMGFAAKGQYDLALKRFNETLAGMELKNDHWKNLTYEKADTLEKSGDLDAAKKTFLEIYELDVSFKDVGKRVDSL